MWKAYEHLFCSGDSLVLDGSIQHLQHVFNKPQLENLVSQTESFPFNWKEALK